mmetsp:Transcript_30659/g.37442  ORF Transcript_30659/g.37442 Transcript_30659/m.37442 type:complete len:536 (-) Transcript_30659:135-1742(-)
MSFSVSHSSVDDFHQDHMESTYRLASPSSMMNSIYDELPSLLLSEPNTFSLIESSKASPTLESRKHNNVVVDEVCIKVEDHPGILESCPLPSPPSTTHGTDYRVEEQDSLFRTVVATPRASAPDDIYSTPVPVSSTQKVSKISAVQTDDISSTSENTVETPKRTNFLSPRKTNISSSPLTPYTTPNSKKNSSKSKTNVKSPKNCSETPTTPSSTRKNPLAPKRFKSPYILFFTAQRPIVEKDLGPSASFSTIARKVATLWRDLPLDSPERQYWNEEARKDKIRYMVESRMFNGSWTVGKKVKKDPSAPKRPMSAFLHYAKSKRQTVKKDHPGLTNSEISKLLGKMWKGMTDDDKRLHCEWEEEERKTYNENMKKWREERQKTKDDEKKRREEIVSILAGHYDKSGSLLAFNDGDQEGKFDWGDHSFLSDGELHMSQHMKEADKLYACPTTPLQNYERVEVREDIITDDYCKDVTSKPLLVYDAPPTPEVIQESKAMLMGHRGLPLPYFPNCGDTGNVRSEEWSNGTFGPLDFGTI